MDELARKIADVREDMQPRWDEERAQQVYAGIDQLRRRRATVRATSAMAVAAAATLAFFVYSEDSRTPGSVESHAQVPIQIDRP